MASLPLTALTLVRSGSPVLTERAFAAASFLLLLVIVLFVIARKIGGWGPGHLSDRGMRRVREASMRDAARYTQRLAATDGATVTTIPVAITGTPDDPIQETSR
jgi:phosphate transport system permease protein